MTEVLTPQTVTLPAVTTQDSSPKYISPGLRGSSPCFISIYQDGVPASETDLTRMHTYDYGAVEFYAGGAEVPIEYNMTGNSCGVLLLWTRER